MKRRDIFKWAAVLTLIPLANRLPRIQAAPAAVRTIDDQEPYGFQPPHQRCIKWEKPKDKDK
ncbi:MAG: hypothetical protein ACYS21_05470 [Planctomycetota bacterium]|jgi:hypothetical protein